MQLFEGGDINGAIGLRSGLLTGAGVDGALGGLIAPVFPEPFVIFGNPAALGRIEERTVVISSAPTVEFNILNFSDPSATVQGEVDARLDAFDRAHLQRTDPKVTGTIGRTGSLVTGFALSLPVESDDEDMWFGGRFPRLFDRVAFGYTEPLVLHVNMIYSGLRTRLRTIDPNPENEILLYASIKTDADLLLTSDSWNVSLARETGDFWIGLGFQRTAGRLEIHGNQRTDGIMSKAGIESSFNDPQSPWDDDYFAGAHGSFDGSAWATRLGMLYQPSDYFIFAAAGRLQGAMRMNGELDLSLHTFRPLRLSAPEGEKKFDVNAIEDASELTRTVSKSFETSSTLEAEIPSEVSVASTYTGLLQPTLTWTKYFGELSYRYQMSENGAPFTYKRGFKADWGAGLGLNIGFLQLSVGALKMVDVVAGYHDVRGNPIPPARPMLIPRLAVGFTTGLTDHLSLGVLIAGLPEDALRLTLKYSL